MSSLGSGPASICDFVCLCVCVCVCSDLISGQTAEPIGFIFGIYISGIPGSVIGYINLIIQFFKKALLKLLWGFL